MFVKERSVTMTAGEWQCLPPIAPNTPVLFYSAGGLAAESYCDGAQVRISRYWDGRRGWQPCVLVELGAAF